MKYVQRLSIGLAFSAALAAGVVYAKTQPETLYSIGLPGATTPATSATRTRPVTPAAPGSPAAPGALAAAGTPSATGAPAAPLSAEATPSGPAGRPAPDRPATQPRRASVPPARPAPVRPAPPRRRAPSPPPRVVPKPVPPKPAPVPPLAEAAVLKAQVTAMVNTERETAGCAPLRVDARLAGAAQKHSDDMARLGYFSHDSKDGRSAFDRIRAEGYSSGRAENIAKGQQDAGAVMRAWNASAGHHSNIVDCTSKAIGVGVARGSDGALVWTQDFGAA